MAVHRVLQSAIDLIPGRATLVYGVPELNCLCVSRISVDYTVLDTP